jgi:hypothetical protein
MFALQIESNTLFIVQDLVYRSEWAQSSNASIKSRFTNDHDWKFVLLGEDGNLEALLAPGIFYSH